MGSCSGCYLFCIMIYWEPVHNTLNIMIPSAFCYCHNAPSIVSTTFPLFWSCFTGPFIQMHKMEVLTYMLTLKKWCASLSTLKNNYINCRMLHQKISLPQLKFSLPNQKFSLAHHTFSVPHRNSINVDASRAVCGTLQLIAARHISSSAYCTGIHRATPTFNLLPHHCVTRKFRYDTHNVRILTLSVTLLKRPYKCT